MTTRPPRANQHQKEQPDKPGRWWFQGFSVAQVGTVRSVMPVQNRPFEVVEQDGAMVPVVPETSEPYTASELIGWWTEEENM